MGFWGWDLGVGVDIADFRLPICECDFLKNTHLKSEIGNWQSEISTGTANR
jgi:hypothetical protein